MNQKTTSTKEGAVFTSLAGNVKSKKIYRCGVQHTTKFRKEIERVGLALKDSSTEVQIETLIKILLYRGSKGINTLEGMACGFLRIATRINEIKAEGYIIEKSEENVIGSDGIVHRGIARYFMKSLEKRISPQLSLDLGERP